MSSLHSLFATENLQNYFSIIEMFNVKRKLKPQKTTCQSFLIWKPVSKDKKINIVLIFSFKVIKGMLDIITHAISSTQIACDVMCVQHVIQ